MISKERTRKAWSSLEKKSITTMETSSWPIQSRKPRQKLPPKKKLTMKEDFISLKPLLTRQKLKNKRARKISKKQLRILKRRKLLMP